MEILCVILFTNGINMADFKTAYNPTIFLWEGFKLENVDNDRGGMTFAGISKVYHPNWDGWQYIESAEKARKEVEKFYRDIWERLNLGKINSNKIATQIYQAYINCWTPAAKWAQEVCNSRGARLSVDGIIGMITISEINMCPEDYFIEQYYKKQVLHYDNIRAKAILSKELLDKKQYSDEDEQSTLETNAGQIKFYDGWIARAKYFSKQ